MILPGRAGFNPRSAAVETDSLSLYHRGILREEDEEDENEEDETQKKRGRRRRRGRREEEGNTDIQTID